MIKFYLYICNAFGKKTQMNSKSSYCNKHFRKHIINAATRPVNIIGLVSVIIIIVSLNVIIIQ